ncbi:hypothetical protein GEMRC1_012931 [Eukaryota sp. GEM-RC1]
MKLIAKFLREHHSLRGFRVVIEEFNDEDLLLDSIERHQCVKEIALDIPDDEFSYSLIEVYCVCIRKGIELKVFYTEYLSDGSCITSKYKDERLLLSSAFFCLPLSINSSQFCTFLRSLTPFQMSKWSNLRHFSVSSPIDNDTCHSLIDFLLISTYLSSFSLNFLPTTTLFADVFLSCLLNRFPALKSTSAKEREMIVSPIRWMIGNTQSEYSSSTCRFECNCFTDFEVEIMPPFNLFLKLYTVLQSYAVTSSIKFYESRRRKENHWRVETNKRSMFLRDDSRNDELCTVLDDSLGLAHLDLGENTTEITAEFCKMLKCNTTLQSLSILPRLHHPTFPLLIDSLRGNTGIKQLVILSLDHVDLKDLLPHLNGIDDGIILELLKLCQCKTTLIHVGFPVYESFLQKRSTNDHCLLHYKLAIISQCYLNYLKSDRTSKFACFDDDVTVAVSGNINDQDVLSLEEFLKGTIPLQLHVDEIFFSSPVCAKSIFNLCSANHVAQGQNHKILSNGGSYTDFSTFVSQNLLKIDLHSGSLSINNHVFNAVEPYSSINLGSKLFLTSDVDELTDLSDLCHLTHLTVLSIFKGCCIHDFSPIKELSHLKVLILANSSIKDLSCLSMSSSIKVLDLSGTRIESLIPLRNLFLSVLNLNSSNVFDLNPLSSLYQLIALDIGGTCVDDLKPLKRLFMLVDLNVSFLDVCLDSIKHLPCYQCNFKSLYRDDVSV